MGLGAVSPSKNGERCDEKVSRMYDTSYYATINAEWVGLTNNLMGSLRGVLAHLAQIMVAQFDICAGWGYIGAGRIDSSGTDALIVERNERVWL